MWPHLWHRSGILHGGCSSHGPTPTPPSSSAPVPPGHPPYHGPHGANASESKGGVRIWRLLHLHSPWPFDDLVQPREQPTSLIYLSSPARFRAIMRAACRASRAPSRAQGKEALPGPPTILIVVVVERAGGAWHSPVLIVLCDLSQRDQPVRIRRARSPEGVDPIASLSSAVFAPRHSRADADRRLAARLRFVLHFQIPRKWSWLAPGRGLVTPCCQG